MQKAERKPFRLMRWTGFVLTLLASAVFLVSFFLPTAVQIGSLPGAPLNVQSGWQTFVESFMLAVEAAGYQFQPLPLLCVLSPLPNGLMLLGPLANLTMRHYAVFFGAILLIVGTSALWVCLEVYEGLSVGFYLWMGSILTMALASFLVSGSYLMEENAEHERLLTQLKKTHGSCV